MFDLVTNLQWEQIQQHTLDCYPNEMCGVLTSDTFIPVTNVAENPQKNFKLDNLELGIVYTKFEPKAIVHSHCVDPRKVQLFDPRTPSCEDIEGQKKSNLPWLIVGCEGMSVSAPIYLPRVKNSNYYDRQFMWYMNDCYTLVQDFYKFELGIDLPDHKAKEGYEVLRKQIQIFEPFITEYGFKEVSLDSLQEGDLLLVDNAGFEENHLVIYTQGQLLHQNTMSMLVPFETFLGRVKKVLRYVG